MDFSATVGCGTYYKCGYSALSILQIETAEIFDKMYCSIFDHEEKWQGMGCVHYKNYQDQLLSSEIKGKPNLNRK